MTDVNNVYAGESSVGNIFLFIMSVMAKHKDATDLDIAMRYAEAQTTDAQYNASVDKWKQDASLLPNAGFKQHHDETYTPSGKGVGQTVLGTMLGGVIGAIVGVIISLFAIGLSLAWLGIGCALIGIAVSLSVMLPMLLAGKDTPLTQYTAAYNEYDPNQQAAASNKVQTDQTEVQRIQSNLNQIMQQYIGPANDMKTQDANMIQAAMQWYKAMMWTQGAA